MDIIVEEEIEYDVDKGIGVPILTNINIILKGTDETERYKYGTGAPLIIVAYNIVLNVFGKEIEVGFNYGTINNNNN